MKKKNIAMLVSVVLLLCAAIGGTLAWLTAKTDAVTNTFTPSTISIKLEETTPNATDRTNIKMVPGNTITKDPKVTVLTGSEVCWLFIKVEAANDAANYLDYTMATGWTAVADHTGYYYREVNEEDIGDEFSILAGDTVTVKSSVTSEMMASLVSSGKNPTLTFKAAAVQKANVAEADAWNALPDEFKS